MPVRRSRRLFRLGMVHLVVAGSVACYDEPTNPRGPDAQASVGTEENDFYYFRGTKIFLDPVPSEIVVSVSAAQSEIQSRGDLVGRSRLPRSL
jgi:hypothetical protein